MNYKTYSRKEDVNLEDVYYIQNPSVEYIKKCYSKNTSAEALAISNQFLSIERILVDAFEYVMPIAKNSETSSAKFATIIREACNLFEIISKSTFKKLYEVPVDDRLNIFHFLTLDEVLNFSGDELRAPIFDTFHIEKVEPFKELKHWSRKKKLSQEYIPFWWKAYNSIKHEINSINEYATLKNSIYALAALFLIIRKIYGDGLISGYLKKPSTLNERDILLFQIRGSQIFFGELNKIVSRSH